MGKFTKPPRLSVKAQWPRTGSVYEESMRYKCQAIEGHPQTDLQTVPFRDRSVFGGCSLERASTQCPGYHLASFLSLAHSLSGNATPLRKLQFSVWTPSDCQVPSQVGSSHEFNRVPSWMHPTCGHYHHNEYLRRGTSPHPIQRR
jgi:hypothetical protein